MSGRVAYKGVHLHTDYIHVRTVGSTSGICAGTMQQGLCYLKLEETERVLGENHARRAASEAGKTSDFVYVPLTRTWCHRDRTRKVIERCVAGECPEFTACAD